MSRTLAGSTGGWLPQCRYRRGRPERAVPVR